MSRQIAQTAQLCALALVYRPHILGRCGWVLSGYWQLFALLSVFVVVASTLRSGWKGLRNGLRIAALRWLWPATYTTAMVFSWPGAVFVFLYCCWFGVNAVIPDSAYVPTMADDGTPVIHVAASYAEWLMFLTLIPTVIVMFFGLALLFSAVTRLAWPLKVVADVACFMGDRSYAERLMGLVRTALREASYAAGDRVIVAGHSLGSAIALYSLLEEGATIPEGARLTLITMGSPITRLLARFFPGAAPTADDAARALRASFPGVCWINIFRPNDPIGAGLFTSPAAFTRDISTDQPEKRRGAAHCGYWDDPKVSALARDAVAELERSGLTMPGPSADADMPAPRVARAQPAQAGRRKLARGMPMIVAAVGCVVILIGVNVSDLIRPRAGSRFAENAKILVREKAPSVPGWLYRFGEWVTIGSGPNTSTSWVENFYVTFTPLGEKKPVIHHVSSDSLSGSLRSQVVTSGTEVKIRRQMNHEEVAARRMEVRVRYLPRDTSVFDLRNQPPIEVSENYLEIGFRVFHSVMLTGLVALFVVPLGGYIYCIYLGK